MTLREYISFWQEAYDRHQSRATTYAAHNYVFKNHILPGLGDVPLSELTSEMVGEFLEERRRFGNHRPGSSGLGEETMRHIHRLLQQCLDQAIRDGLITENPAKSFHYRKSTTVKADIMTPLEMEDYLDAAERLGYLPMFMLALTAGLRQGELIALKWSDLDIESRTLTVAENRAVERRELVEYGSQTRSIRLTPEVADLLIMEHAKHHKQSADVSCIRPRRGPTRRRWYAGCIMRSSGKRGLTTSDSQISGTPAPFYLCGTAVERHQGTDADAGTLSAVDNPAEL